VLPGKLPVPDTSHAIPKNSQNVWKQKRRGSKFLRAYPNTQAFALPLSKDKQRKACPRQPRYIRIHRGQRSFPLLTARQRCGLAYPRTPPTYIRKDSTPVRDGVHLIIYIKGMLAAGRYKIYPRRRSLLHHRCR